MNAPGRSVVDILRADPDLCRMLDARADAGVDVLRMRTVLMPPRADGAVRALQRRDDVGSCVAVTVTGGPPPSVDVMRWSDPDDTSLRSHEEAMVASLSADNPFPAPVFDIAVHHCDLHEALGLQRPAERYWLPVAEAMTRRAGGLAGVVAPYEMFRAVFSRRSRAQMRAWGTGLSDDELDAVCLFGPREDDQPIPAA